MTRWAVITVVLYLVVVSALTIPIAVAAFWSRDSQPLRAAFEVLGLWPYWISVGALGAAQALFLIVPVKARQDITLKKRHLFTPLVAGGFAMAVLFGAVLMLLLAVIFGDNIGDIWLWIVLGVMIAAWVAWFLIFRRFSRTGGNASDWLGRITKYLYRGSILELLIAVSSHIIVRKRGDCSAPVGTFWGIMAGVAVMFLSFGPGVFYLFADRRERMLSRRRREALERGENAGEAGG